MKRPAPSVRPPVAVSLAAVAAALGGTALARELGGAGPGALRPAFAGLAALASVACLLAARRERGAAAWTLGALGATLALGALAALA
jgi:hypothetical protein